jgi:GNAT superfamily N-acetyltransferase
MTKLWRRLQNLYTQSYPFRKVRGFFYFNIDNKIVHLQNNIGWFSDAFVTKKLGEGYVFEPLVLSSIEQINIWADIVNEAYDDTNYSQQEATKALTAHLFLQDLETFFLKYENKYVGTVSIGQYQENIDVGGCFRLAVKRGFQGKDLGKALIYYGYAKLRERGIEYGESVISSKRSASMMLHFSLGFKPQYDMESISYKGALSNVNLIQRYRLRNRLRSNYQQYIMDFSRYFETT